MSETVFKGDRKNAVTMTFLVSGLGLIWWGAYSLGKLYDGIWFISAFWIVGTLAMWIVSWKNAFDIKFGAESFSYKKSSDTVWKEIRFTDIQKVKFLITGRYGSLVIHTRFKEIILSMNSTSNLKDLRVEFRKRLGDRYDDGTLLESLSKLIPT